MNAEGWISAASPAEFHGGGISEPGAADTPDIAVIGVPPRIVRTPGISIETLFGEIGHNTGNLAFAVAAHEQMYGTKTYYNWDFDPAVLNERHQRAVLVCANMVNPYLDLWPLADRIEQLRIPFCAFSMGVQAPLNQFDIKLTSGTTRFLHASSERAVSLGIRGEATAAILDGMGIHNWRIVGCPSNFLNAGTSFVNHDWSPALARPAGKLGVHVEHVGPFVRYIAQCRRLVGDAPHLFVVQSPAGSLRLVAEALTDKSPLEPGAMAWLAPFGATGQADGREMLRQKFRCYFGMGDWITAMGEWRFSFGARLHGNIVAIQCGVPSLVVVHDERTRELAECLALPNLLLADFFRLSSLGEAIEIAVEGLARYPKRRRELAREFVDLLTDNGLVPSIGLRGVAA
jgi:hypothetical protein